MAAASNRPSARDSELAHRVREILAGAGSTASGSRRLDEEGIVTEKAMFGGLAFLCNGNMAVAALGPDRNVRPQGLMVRCAREDTDDLLARDGVEPMIMSRGPVKGWVRLPAERIATKRQLGTWVRLGWRYALTLPPK